MICNKVKTKSEKIPLVGIVEIDSIIYDYLDSILYFSKYKDLYDILNDKVYDGVERSKYWGIKDELDDNSCCTLWFNEEVYFDNFDRIISQYNTLLKSFLDFINNTFLILKCDRSKQSKLITKDIVKKKIDCFINDWYSSEIMKNFVKIFENCQLNDVFYIYSILKKHHAFYDEEMSYNEFISDECNLIFCYIVINVGHGLHRPLYYLILDDRCLCNFEINFKKCLEKFNGINNMIKSSFYEMNNDIFDIEQDLGIYVDIEWITIEKYLTDFSYDNWINIKTQEYSYWDNDILDEFVKKACEDEHEEVIANRQARFHNLIGDMVDDEIEEDEANQQIIN